jgi:hypothetical protein
VSKKKPTIVWEKCKGLLLDGTRSAIEAFFKKTARKELCAIGYVFELGNESPQFDLCADTRSNRKRSPDWALPDVRWNSGNYEFPAGLSNCSELGSEWNAEANKLHALAEDEQKYDAVYKGLVRLGCVVLVELAREGFLGEWRVLDFNVSEVGDPIKLVAARDAKIKKLIDSD